MQRLIHPLILLSALAFMPSMAANASDIRLGIDIGESVYSQNNYLDRGDLDLPGELPFSRDVTYNLVNIYPMLSFSLAEGVDVIFQGDIHLEHHFDDVEEDEAEAELTGAYLSFDNRRLAMDIGIQPVQFGKGHILTDEAPAVDIKLRAGDGYFGFTAARVLDQSPVIGLTLGYTPGFLEHLSLFGVWFNDQDDAFARSIPLRFQVLPDPESEGDLYWIGASADLFIGKALFSMVGAYQFGQVTRINANNRVSKDTAGFFGDLSLEANLSSSWSAGVFCVVASGDDSPLQGDINAFVSVQSYNSRADIFFDPDFLDYDNEERLTYGAGFFGGVIAPGLTLSFAPAEDWRIDAVAATFFAHEALDDDSRWYGWEADLGIQYTFGRYYTLYGQASRFWHGDYYEALLDESNDPASRLVVGLKASF